MISVAKTILQMLKSIYIITMMMILIVPNHAVVLHVVDVEAHVVGVEAHAGTHVVAHVVVLVATPVVTHAATPVVILAATHVATPVVAHVATHVVVHGVDVETLVVTMDTEVAVDAEDAVLALHVVMVTILAVILAQDIVVMFNQAAPQIVIKMTVVIKNAAKKINALRKISAVKMIARKTAIPAIHAILVLAKTLYHLAINQTVVEIVEDMATEIGEVAVAAVVAVAMVIHMEAGIVIKLVVDILTINGILAIAIHAAVAVANHRRLITIMT
jgi:hypothetical protein